jgi:hypothetical protein
MGRYDRYTSRDPLESDKGLHPIWRGIGCVMLVLLPVMGYAASSLLLAANQKNAWIRVPPEAAKTIVVPFVGAIPFLFAKLAVTLLVLVLGYGVLIVFYSAFYRAVGPPKYGPTDAPPPKRTKKKKRKLY